MDIKIESIPSSLPNWFDPSAPRFKPPKDWTGTRVRIGVPINTNNPNQELEQARELFSKQYPGADIHLVPEFTRGPKPDVVKTSGSDLDLLRDYFSQIVLPPDISPNQLIAYLSGYLPSVSAFGIQKMKFLDIEAENVLCFEQVKWNLNRKGITLITGTSKDWPGRSNGVGKSSLSSLPFIALFGKTFKEQTHDEWAHRFNKTKAWVRLKIRLSDNKVLEIYRQRRPGLLRVYLDGEEMTMGRPEATQAYIEKITGLTWEILTNAIYIGQSEVGSIFGTEKERKELFSRLLGLERFLDVQAKLRKIVLKISRAAEDISNDINLVTVQISESEDYMRQIRTGLRNTPKVQASELTQRSQDIAFINKQIKEVELDLIDKQKAVDKDSDELSNILSVRGQYEGRISAIRQTLHNSHKSSTRCAVCGSKVDPKTLTSYQNELLREIKQYQTKLQQSDKDLLSIRERNNRDILRVLQIELTQLRVKLREKDLQLERLTEKREERRRVAEALHVHRERLHQLRRILQIHKQAYEYTLNEKKFLEVCVNSVSRDGLPAYLCSVVAPSLNQASTHYSEIFTDGEISTQFKIAGGDIDIEVVNMHGGDAIKDQSQGEMRLAAIGTAFTFRDVLVPLNILICDEPSEGLDPINSAAFSKGLMKVAERFQHIVVISHNANLVGALEPDRRIEVVKHNRISTVSII